MAVAAMLSVQLGAALSVHLFDAVGPAGTAWLRLSAGALIFLALRRPRLRRLGWRGLRAALALGVTTGLVTTTFLSALDRIPLGTAVAIEFMGPLSVAVFRSHQRRLLVWPALALVGVVLLTEPWQGSIDPVGVLLAGMAALGWATYILLPQHVGDRIAGLAAIGLAVLLPVLPFSLELLALRRLTTAAFGTLMSIEPALGLIMGLVLLAQVPTPVQVLGIALVVTAGIGATRSGRRAQSANAPPTLIE